MRAEPVRVVPSRSWKLSLRAGSRDGKSVFTSTIAKTNLAKSLDAKGQPSLTRPNIRNSMTRWPPPSFSPSTGLFYVNASNAYSV